MTIIDSSESIQTVQTSWAGVTKMRDRMKLLVLATFANGAITAPALGDVVYNLPMLLAFDVLKQALVFSSSEGKFKSKGSQLGLLGPLMEDAKEEIPWLDWTNLRKGVWRRNAVAHDGKLFDCNQCMSDIESVEKQLAAWNVVHEA